MTFPGKPQTRITGLLIAGIVIFGLGGAAMAQNGPRGGERFGRGAGRQGGGPEVRLERMVQKLDLSEDQAAAVKDLHEGTRKANLELRKELMRLRHEKRGELLKDEPAQKTVLNLTRKIGELRTEMQTNRMRTKLEVRELLTPEQRDKMLVLGEGRRGHRGEGRSGRMHGQRQGQCGGKGQQGCGQR